MIQNFLLIKSSADVSGLGEESIKSISEFIEMLKELGYRVKSITTEDHIEKKSLDSIDAIILQMRISNLNQWTQKLSAIKDLPFIWWCDSHTAVNDNCKLDLGIDGIVFPQMKSVEIHWTFHLCSNQHLQKTQWKKEREQLLSKLEERKWIEQAKGIISKIKNISEAEAYDFLRKQAMNDRKRLADVAISIVKVHQLLND
ncbi:ANTAR domain-containing response regulator [Chengkuizengella axinellae]|uniref:ANTAR domain-containing protein n=1 Tax=Chengkuizengella axinellae TaxID=3064388 RepID=A0ABT9J0F5_9BACL|nr:ANTAR domain-containing protein [Chengkuizengella sp. 2205SS18-9]MDP5275045.1 ANTAR domain-containing protein [Chengkuizengella sp. 2205SS18-9]